MAVTTRKSPQPPRIPDARKTGGGTAIGGGVHFQALVTAIVGVHILRGTALGWLDGVCHDRPVAVWAESEGPGDDLRIELDDGNEIEVQVKQGLKRGGKLWNALLPIAQAISTGAFAYGLLVVASDSSKTIAKDLAIDIQRLGQGRTDSLKPIGKDWLKRLKAANLPVQKVCQALRIRTIHGLSFEDTSALAAKEVLRHVCANGDSAHAAWNMLCHRAVQSIAQRGRWTLQDLVYLFKSEMIPIRDDAFPASILSRHTQWVTKTNDHFSINGIRRKIPIAHLLAMKLESASLESQQAPNLFTALERYHSSAKRDHGGGYDSVWAGRFRKRVVVVAGPGLGKSTMIKELAHQYAQDGFVVLNASLKSIAAAMARGAAFYDLLLSQSLSGSGISPEQITSQKRLDWVVLLDGLDECGNEHHEVAEQIYRFGQGHPGARIIVTTRPIGYATSAFSDWTHYNLLPPASSDGAANLGLMVTAINGLEADSSCSTDLLPGGLGKHLPSEAIAISPQLLGMSAALIYRHQTLPQTRHRLYFELIKLFTEQAIERAPEHADIAICVLDIIGWHLVCNPLISFEGLVERSATTLSPLINKPALSCRSDVRTAVAQWERVGLVERVYHSGTELLTFIHKTFCEFVAARYSVAHSQQVMAVLVAHSDLWEVIEFATAMGLADELVELYLDRHAAGFPRQLQAALALLKNEDVRISDSWLSRLIQASFTAVERGAEDRFRIGMLLSTVGAKAFRLVSDAAAPRLHATEPDVRLVAWGAIVTCGPSHYDADSITAALADLLPGLSPFNLSDRLNDKNDSNRDLLHHMALGALKAQSDEHVESFVQNNLGDTGLLSIGFITEINEVLQSRGMKELPTGIGDPGAYVTPVTLACNNASWIQASQQMCRSIASAFSPGGSTESRPQKLWRGFPYFSAFVRSSGFLTTPASDVFSWVPSHDEAAANSVMRIIARLLPLNSFALAQEARGVLSQLDLDPPASIFRILGRIDVPPLVWDSIASLQFDHGEVKRALLHTSGWISKAAAEICKQIPMALSELQVLMGQATGSSLRNIIMLTAHHHPQDFAQVLVQRLEQGSAGDISGVFDAMFKLDTPPSLKGIGLSLGCLCSDKVNTVESAVKVLLRWLGLGAHIDEAPVADALHQWGGLNKPTHSLVRHSPVDSLKELLDAIVSKDIAIATAE
jgi:hypothetical protein